MSTFLRPFKSHVLTAPQKVLCDACSRYDAAGSPVTPPEEEQIGVRCWAPLWSLTPTPCASCGDDANRRIPWDDIPAECKAPA